MRDGRQASNDNRRVHLAPFKKELEKHKTTKGTLQIPYNKPLPEALIRKIAWSRVREVAMRLDDGFW